MPARRRSTVPAKRTTGQHRIKLTVEHKVVGPKAIIFDVTANRRAFGQLQVSQGGIAWISKHYAKGPKMTWEKFDEKMSKPRRPRRSRA